MNSLFFELIRLAIGKQDSLSRQPSADEWGALYKMAVKQTLVGICFTGVSKLVNSDEGDFAGMPKTLYYQWLGYASKIQARNEVMNERCVELQRKVRETGFNSFIMKGQGIAVLYGDLAGLRQSGDIDIYLEGGYDKVLQFVNATFPTRLINSLEIHYHCFEDVEVEIHFKPFVIDGPNDRLLQRFFKELSKACFENICSLGFSVPTLEFNIVYQLVHIHHHLLYEGIGMRQLMDYSFLLQRLQFSVPKSISVIKELNLIRFASALMWVLGEVFGLDREKMLWEPNENDGRFLLEEIIQSGNFGKQDERQKCLYDSRWNSFWIIYGKTFRFHRFAPWAWLWSPIWRIKGFVWRKFKRYN